MIKAAQSIASPVSNAFYPHFAKKSSGDVLELSEDEMWKYYHELLDMPVKSDKLSQEGRIVAVERRQPLIDYSGDDLSLDSNMWYKK